MNSKIKVIQDGPYLVSGGVPLREKLIVANSEGESIDYQVSREFEVSSEFALCRCGKSSNKPFCDGSHAGVGFDGSETADRAPYAHRAELFRGPYLSLTDQEGLCAFARFCDPNGRVWNQVEKSDIPQVADTFVPQVNKCPAGRLVPWETQSGMSLEQARDPQVSILQDPEKQCSGPIWVEGGISIEAADGFIYESRNRVTLCRCGQSGNKPFCDGTHAAIGFRDELGEQI
ncbi:MAG: CDGSH iron-sulfur domain-containing protein [Zoogloeaceae bacterium]|nr:CDGSH iron-sulfur domain-containing protein [Zoogloeaceae bacterium]